MVMSRKPKTVYPIEKDGTTSIRKILGHMASNAMGIPRLCKDLPVARMTIYRWVAGKRTPNKVYHPMIYSLYLKMTNAKEIEELQFARGVAVTKAIKTSANVL
jgi:hypothetical protein